MVEIEHERRGGNAEVLWTREGGDGMIGWAWVIDVRG